ncbi:MAG TPA: TAT-variant-translocated molybdopterin oxidoreductase, partial [Lacipirellulaceae bacterium]|nr:TAT-variant-translocated molybdopterin oxidoreductase [Lacipirellulaceae bacterium]
MTQYQFKSNIVPTITGDRPRIDRRQWRGLEELEELTDSPEFQKLLKQEFPDHADSWSDPVSRRKFLTLMGASLALSGLSGCAPQAPVGKILPYARQPEQMVLGKAQQFATAFTMRGFATGIL